MNGEQGSDGAVTSEQTVAGEQVGEQVGQQPTPDGGPTSAATAADLGQPEAAEPGTTAARHELRYDEASPHAARRAVEDGMALVVLRPAEVDAAPYGPPLLAEEHVRSGELAPESLLAVAAGTSFHGLRPIVELAVGGAAAVELTSIAAGLVGWPLGAPGGSTGDGSTGDGSTGDGSTGGGRAAPVVRLVAAAARSGRPDPVAEALLVFGSVPGVSLAAPGDTLSCHGAMRAALAHDGPVVVLERTALAGQRAELPAELEPLPPGRARLVRPGRQMTVVAAQQVLAPVLAAADQLAGESGIALEVIDPCWLIPFDDAAVVTSLERTAKLLVVSDCPLASGWAAALVARLVAEHLDLFDAPPRLLGPDELGGRLPDAGGIARVAGELAAY